MKTMFLAAAVALSLGTSAAYADGGDSTAANTFFTQLPGVVAQADAPNAPAYAQNRQPQVQAQSDGQATHLYVTNSSKGTWLFAPNGNAGANS